MPKSWEVDSLPQDEPGHQEYSSHTENVSSESIVFERRVRANKGWAGFTDFLALSSRVTEWDSRHIDIGIGILPD